MTSIKKLEADEAIALRGDYNRSPEDTLKEIAKIQSQDDKFSELYTIVFGKKEQINKDTNETKYKIMSSLPDGRVVFVDRSQSEKDINLEEPYVCLVFKRDKEAFAKILFPQYQPHIYVPASRIPAMVWRDKSGKTQTKNPDGSSYEERMMSAITEMESMGFEHVKVVFRKNIRD